MNIVNNVLTKLYALWSFLIAVWKNGGRDIFSGIVLIAVIITMFSLSFTPGECDGEFSPILCIDVYKYLTK